ncbi:MAG: hypothetical protein P8X90_24140 [Desulfobacterales bacterium]|jgi:hypothetical protein
MEIFAEHASEFNTPTRAYALLFFSETKKPALFLRSGILNALHHLFSYAGLKKA